MNAGPVVIMAGGTGGHVFPGLAVAEALKRRDGAVVWLGTRRGMEARLVPQHGIDIEWISISGLRGKGALAWVAAPFRIALAVAQVLAMLNRRRPSAVLGMGGFVAGPGGLAAWLARRPLLIHEQNAIAGTTNRWLARLAARVFEAFPGSFPPGVRAEHVGNPVRASIEALPPPRERFAHRSGQRPRLLVLGGSQGARALNRLLPEALALLPPERRPEVRHQAGSRNFDDTRGRYAELHGADERMQVTAFIDDMAEAYGWADLVVARAGALTVSELAAAGVGAVLIPFPHAIDDHQTKNAEAFTGRGAGVIIAERDLTPERLARELDALLHDRAKLLELAERARAQAKPGAAERIAAACMEAGGAR
ncbi:MAG TPA: undecaprenyldiphospho-muramoylpentapeptide beta-N-acetylglucosaminyltransferase [Gammaproteobacteria bacterium]